VKRLVAFILLVTASLRTDCEAAAWLYDYKTALNHAAAQDKGILINFTGSDWCGWCIKLKKEVFDQPEFGAFAAENLILLEVDFPRGKPQSSQMRENNQKLSTQFGVKGYPTVFLLNSKGQKVAKTGYAAGGAQNYISQLAKIKGIDWRSYTPVEQATAQAQTQLQPEAVRPAKKKELVYTPPPPPAEIKYGELTLKGISGNSRKLALINDQTFFVGDIFKVKTGDKQVSITCKEIRDASVLIQVEGEPEPRELMLMKKE
jgi:protein disulfide-isomerase